MKEMMSEIQGSLDSAGSRNKKRIAQSKTSLTAEVEAKLKQEALEVLKERNIQKLIKSGVGRRFVNRTFATLKVDEDNKRAVEIANSFVNHLKLHKETDKGILFTGGVGTGKTHIACAIANELIGLGFNIGYGNITDIINRIQASYSKKAEMTEAEIIDELLKYDLLIIDDLGKETESSNNSKILYNLINRLYEDLKPIVVTTNYNANSLANKYGEAGEAIVSRLSEMTVAISLNGQDRRVR